jgi:hypothetical protein
VEIVDSGSFVSPEGLWRILLSACQPGLKQIELAATVHLPSDEVEAVICLSACGRAFNLKFSETSTAVSDAHDILFQNDLNLTAGRCVAPKNSRIPKP